MNDKPADKVSAREWWIEKNADVNIHGQICESWTAYPTNGKIVCNADAPKVIEHSAYLAEVEKVRMLKADRDELWQMNQDLGKALKESDEMNDKLEKVKF